MYVTEQKTDINQQSIMQNNIQGQIYKYLSADTSKTENDVRALLYAALNIKYRQLLRMLNNHQQPDLIQAKKIAETLNCTVEDLITE